MGFEPTTASLEGWNSTTELRPPTVNLPTLHDLPAISRPEQACAPPHHILHDHHSAQADLNRFKFGGQARIRTLEAIRQQIYSLPPLSTWVPARLSHQVQLKQRPSFQASL